MRQFNRTERIVKELQRAIATIIHKKIRDPRINMITVSEVEISRDLSQAKIFVTFFNEDSIKKIKHNINILQKASGFIRNCLSKCIRLRTVPKLFFLYDKSLQNGIYISNLISKFKK